MRKLILLTLLSFLIAGPARAADAPAAKAPPVRQKLFNAETFMLANGMQVVLIPNHRAPVALAMVWYKIGSADESAHKTGLAHFLEHLMFKGSPNVPPGELSKRVRSLGGNDNAFTTHDYTAYFQTVALEHLETVMAMEADRMRAITLPPDQFESERQVVLEERRQRTENDPRSYFNDQLRFALYPGHPYGAPVIGWEYDIKHLTRDDAMAWHDTWYTPNNAILVVTGDITLAQLKPMAEKIYGSIPARPVVIPPLPAVNEFPGGTRLTLNDPRIREPQVIRLYRVPACTENKTESLSIALLDEILSGNASTRLYKSLVIEQKLATYAGIGYEDTARSTSMLTAVISPAEGVSLEKAEAGLEAELLKVAEGGVTATELSEAKTRLKDSIAFTRDSLSAPANIVGEALASGLSLDDIEYWADDLDAITTDQVKAVAKKYLVPSSAPGAKPNFVTGYVVAAKPEPGQPAAPAPAPQEIR